MNKNFKKLLGLLLSLAMLCSILPVSVSAAEKAYVNFHEDGYAWLQEADCAATNWPETNKDGDVFSGGKYQRVNTKTAPGAEGYYIDYYLNVPKTGSYDIWIYGTQPTNKYASPAKLLLNGEVVATTVVGADIWWKNNWCYSWNKATVTLQAGQLDLKYLVDAVRPSGDGSYMAIFDMICIVPTEYGWEKSITEKPVKPVVEEPVKEYMDFHEDGYAWLQETDNSAMYGFTENRTGDMYSNNAAIGVNRTAAPEGGAYYVDYYLNVPASGSYDIWVHGTGSSGYISAAKLQLDGETIEMTQDGGDLWDGSAWCYAWKKATVELNEGQIDLRYLVDTVRTSGTANYIGILDMICIVPTEYGWEKSITEKPVKPVVEEPTENYVNFHEDGYAWLQEADCAATNWLELDKDGDVFSGGKYQRVVSKSVPAEGYYIDYFLNVPAAGSYDIWIHGTQPENKYASPAKLLLNGEVVATTVVGGDNWWKTNYCYSWNKATVTLAAGQLDVKYLIDTARPSGDGNYIGIFDMICIVPTEYAWEQSISEKPVKPAVEEPVKRYIDFHEDGYAWLQETDNSAMYGFTENRTGDMYSNDGAIGVNKSESPEGGAYYVDYYLNVPASGSYDIWVHGTGGSGYVSAAKLQLGNETIEMTQDGGDYWDGNVWCYAWKKATVELNEGQIDLRYLVDTVRTSGSANYIGLLDMICIVPTEYGWAKSITEKPVKPLQKYEISNFAIDGTVAAGQTVAATANVKCNDGTEVVNLILVVYDSANQMVAIDVCDKVAGTAAAELDCAITIDANQAGDLYAKALLWTDFSNPEPIVSGISTLN